MVGVDPSLFVRPVEQPLVPRESRSYTQPERPPVQPDFDVSEYYASHFSYLALPMHNYGDSGDAV